MATTRLGASLELYLQREGLSGMLVEPRRRASRFTPPLLLAVLWIIALALVGAVPVYMIKRTPGEFALGFVANLAVILLVGLLLANLMFGRLSREHDIEELELLIVVVSSAGVAASAGLFADDIAASLLAVLLSIVVAGVIAYLKRQPYDLTSMLVTARLAARMAVKSVGLLAVLMPLSLAVVLLTIFTREIWEVLAQIEDGRIPFVIAAIIFPAFVFTVGSLKHEADAVIGSFPTPSAIASRLSKVVDSTIAGDSATLAEIAHAKARLAGESGVGLEAKVLPVLKRRIMILLMLLFVFSSFVLLFAYSAYFTFLFWVLFPSETIAEWTNNSAAAVQHFRVLGGGPRFSVPVILLVNMKVSLLLGAFVTLISNIEALRDRAMTHWYRKLLGEDIERWLVAGSLYVSQVGQAPPPAVPISEAADAVPA